ncbi:MAG: Rrf2 family transcriptional regulator [Paludibaculum sp.]
MRILRLGGLVASVRGQAGGYTLSRPADQVTVSEILSLLGGSFFNPHFCDRHSGLERNCAHSGDCAVRLLWGAVQKSLDAILTKTTLRDLLRNEEDMLLFLKERGASAPVDLQTVPVQTITN